MFGFILHTYMHTYISYTPVEDFFISNDRGRSVFEAFDWLFICIDPSNVRNLRVNVVVEIETPSTTVPRIVTSLVLFKCLMFGFMFSSIKYTWALLK